MVKPRPGARSIWQSRHEDEPTLEEFFSAAALIGFAVTRGRRTTKRAACRWAHEVGAMMANESRQRRKNRSSDA